MRYLVDRNILIISSEPWDHIPVSKHHYARTLASRNRVFFLNPPSNREMVTCPAASENLRVVDYRTFRGINRFPRILRDWLNYALTRKIKRLCGVEFDVVWSFDCFRFQNLSLWKAAVTIYHVVDVHSSGLERQLLESADVLLFVSSQIQDNAGMPHKISARINHGLAQHFLNPVSSSHAPSLVVTSRLRACYVGNLDNWCVDRKTLLQIVTESPDIDFYFIGPYQPESEIAARLSLLSNVTLTGRIASEQLPAWFEQMSLFLMCYDGSAVAVNSNHHKILEFLSTGKPVVINYTDEYKDRRDLVIMSNRNDELPSLFKEVCANIAHYSLPELSAMRIQYAASNSYALQTQRIDELLEPFLR